jgi:hypothetical protein
MTVPRTHSPDELAALERSTGLRLLGYLAAGEPVTLLPILGRVELGEAQRRRLVAALNRAGLPVVAEAPQVEQQGRRAG